MSSITADDHEWKILQYGSFVLIHNLISLILKILITHLSIWHCITNSNGYFLPLDYAVYDERCALPEKTHWMPLFKSILPLIFLLCGFCLKSLRANFMNFLFSVSFSSHLYSMFMLLLTMSLSPLFFDSSMVIVSLLRERLSTSTKIIKKYYTCNNDCYYNGRLHDYSCNSVCFNKSLN